MLTTANIMLDLNRLEQLEVTANPVGQKILAAGLLWPNYNVPPGVDIQVEGLGRIPDEPVVYAMNHTDRYNCWPFQYTLWCRKNRYTATWVKGKYYQNPVIGKILEWTNNIPAVSKGYLVARDFVSVMDRTPTDQEYDHLRSQMDRYLGGAGNVDADDEAATSTAEARGPVPAPIYERGRRILGIPYEPTVDRHGQVLARLHRAMMREFVRLNKGAHAKGVDLLIFPEGTRSTRLSRGKIGLAQIALHLDAPVVPVGCNGSDDLYPGASPIARSGSVTYRIGQPLGADWLANHRPAEAFSPFTPEAETHHADTFRAAINDVMAAINELLDDKYRAPDNSAFGERGAARFV
jgi:1-acyl-sn-glycerol-3-phosphate acyltransferase